eukprot:jgi/Chlat1/6248/Chrsp44S00452
MLALAGIVDGGIAVVVVGVGRKGVDYLATTGMASHACLLATARATCIDRPSSRQLLGFKLHHKRVTSVAISREAATVAQTPVSADKAPATSEACASENSTVTRRAALLGACTLAVAAAVSNQTTLPAKADDGYFTFYGQAAGPASYGGYGGTERREGARYTYDVPEAWKARAISKVEKGTNGTDSEFFNPKKKDEKVYVTSLAGVGRLNNINNTLQDLALSDVRLQDFLGSADNVASSEDRNGSQLYYRYDISSAVGHALINVTSVSGKIYAHFVLAPPKEWVRDEAALRRISASFKTTQYA